MFKASIIRDDVASDRIVAISCILSADCKARKEYGRSKEDGAVVKRFKTNALRVGTPTTLAKPHAPIRTQMWAILSERYGAEEEDSH